MAPTRADVVATLAHSTHLAQSLELTGRLLKLAPRRIETSVVQNEPGLYALQCPIKFKRTGRHADGIIARGVATGLLNSVVHLGEVLVVPVLISRAVGALPERQDVVKVMKVIPGYATILGDIDKGVTRRRHTIHRDFLLGAWSGGILGSSLPSHLTDGVYSLVLRHAFKHHPLCIRQDQIQIRERPVNANLTVSVAAPRDARVVGGTG